LFTLLNPSALLALLGLLVPVAIHLWNRRPGREVAVGSIRWLAAGANRRLRNLKPEQLWLLLLRAALLAVLAVAIAGPVWRQRQPASRGIVLLSPEAMGLPALSAVWPTIDSLRRRGYTLRWLARDFPRVSGAKWRAQAANRGTGLRDSAGTLEATAGATWARVQQAASAFPSQPLFVVTPTTLRAFQGAHPALPTTVTWQTLPTATTTNWLQSAALRGDSLRLVLGRSNENQTAFRLVSVVRPQPGAVLRVAGIGPLRLENQKGSQQLQPLSTSPDSAVKAVLLPIPVRTTPLRVIIYSTNDFAPDARVLQAGIRAAATGLPMPLALTTTTQHPTPASPPDWLFWLSAAPLPAAWRVAAKKGSTIWQEAAGPGAADTAHLVAMGTETAGATVFRRGALPVKADSGVALWVDGQGRPVLERQTLGQGAILHLHTRLNPTWSDLANDAELPARLLALLQPEPSDEFHPTETALEKALATQDHRTLDPTQLIIKAQAGADNPAAASKISPAPAAFRFTDLRPWLVLVAGLLFAFERLLAHRRETQALSSNTI
jgi:hypothetical protein